MKIHFLFLKTQEGGSAAVKRGKQYLLGAHLYFAKLYFNMFCFWMIKACFYQKKKKKIPFGPTLQALFLVLQGVSI